MAADPAAHDVVPQYRVWTRHHLILGALRNVHSELVLLDPAQGWARTPLPGVPPLGHTAVSDTNPLHTDEVLLLTTGFTEAPTLRYGTVRPGPPTFR